MSSNQVTEPNTLFVRRQELLDWLQSRGLSAYMVKKLIRNRVIESRYVGQQTRAYYYVPQVKEVLTLNEEMDNE